MKGFRRRGDVLIWEQEHEIVQIEPWGQDSLRVVFLTTENRATCLPKRGPLWSSRLNLDNRKQGHLFIENRATPS
jgi:hypothetical protein